MKVYTRSMNKVLHDKMKSLIPIECVRVVEMDNHEDCSNYLHYLFQLEDEWVINVDEDCFIFDWDEVLSILEYMKKHSIVYAGMPDGGVCSTRKRSFTAVNPFFTIFNVKEIKKKYASVQEIDSTPMPLNIPIPSYITGEYDHFKVGPFSGVFNWLYFNFTCLPIMATNHLDGVSTELYFSKPFCLHSWYSREYNKNEEHTRRIDALFNEAQLKKKRE